MRCYNGCPDSEYQAVLDRVAKKEKELKQLFNGSSDVSCVYFPAEGKYQVYYKLDPIGEWSESKISAIENAVREVSNGSKRSKGNSVGASL